MKTINTLRFGLISLSAIFCFGCTTTDSNRQQVSETAQNTAAPPANAKTADTASTDSSPCANKFYPVKNGLQRNYDNTIGGKTTLTIEYQDGAREFNEVTVLKGTTVKHVWQCTSDGLVAANYGSAAQMGEVQLTPKHISGVTLPREDEIRVGKTWTTIYQATGTSPMGAVDSTVELRNKIVSLDDEVKTPGGTFKAVKIAIDVVADMKFGGKKMPVPQIKSAAWFAPGIGMIKSEGGIGGVSNTMQYAGGN